MANVDLEEAAKQLKLVKVVLHLVLAVRVNVQKNILVAINPSPMVNNHLVSII